MHHIYIPWWSDSCICCPTSASQRSIMNPQTNHSGHTSVKRWFEFDCVWLLSPFVSGSPIRRKHLISGTQSHSCPGIIRTHAGHQQCAVQNRNNRGKIFILQQTERFILVILYCVYSGISIWTSVHRPVCWPVYLTWEQVVVYEIHSIHFGW